MTHSHSTPSKLEITTHAILPLTLMLFIQMLANHFGAPANSIFVSPYLLAYLVTCALGLIVLWKGQICAGQAGRLGAILPWLGLFAVGNLAYTLSFTPKHAPLWVTLIAMLIPPFLYRKQADDEILHRTLMQSGLAICAVGALAYLAVYWFELPSLMNWVRGNNFAQLLLGMLLAGWYLVLAKSRLEQFLRLLVKIALIILSLNYLWAIAMLYVQFQMMSQTELWAYLAFFSVQFVILAMLAWLLLGKQGQNIKNPLAWTVAMFLSMLYPLTNVI